MIRIVFTLYSLIYFIVGMYGPLYAIFAEKIGGNPLDVGLLFSIYWGIYGAFCLFSGKLTLKFERKIIVIGFLIDAFAIFLYLFAKSVKDLFIIQTLVGISETFFWVPILDLIGKTIGKRKSSAMIIGELEAIAGFSYAFGSALGGFIVKLFGFKHLFLTLSTACILGAIFAFFI